MHSKMMASRFESVPHYLEALSPPVRAKSIGTGQLSGATQQTDQNKKSEANQESNTEQGSGIDKRNKNHNQNILRNSNDDDSNNLKLIHELQKTTQSLSADIQMILNKLDADNQTTQVQFELLRKEMDESKAEAEQRSRLLIALCQQLRHDFDLNALSTLEETISESLTKDAGRKENYQLQGQQKQHCHFTVEKEHIMNNDEQSKIKRHMTEMEKALRGVKEEMKELKNREPRRVSMTYDSENSRKDEEEGFYGGLTERIIMKEEKELEHHFLPSDIYSYFAVADYFKEGRFCMVPTPAFLLASFTLTIQLATLSIFTFDVVDYRNSANPLLVPPGVGTQVRVSQLIALLISCFNQDEVRASFHVLWLGYRKSRVRTINCNATRHKWYFSFFARIFLGWFSLVVTFILIINSDTVRDVMLDFAAVTFVSELDNGAFQLSLWGYMGVSVQELTMKIKNILVYEKAEFNASSRRRKVPRLLWLSLLIGFVVGFWAWITIKQQRGDYLDQSVFVQFGDDFSPVIGAFSGIYEIELDGTFDGMRVNYVEQGRKNNGTDGRFSYCSRDKRWIFQYGNQPEDYVDNWFTDCWHKARSSKTESYDLTLTSTITWFVLDEELTSMENPLQHFLVKGLGNYYGKSCRGNDECGERMYCDDTGNTCLCKDELFGTNCEFQKPCQILEIDSRDPNGFFGTRSWSRRYISLSRDAGEEGINNWNPIQVYGKPVYVGDESIGGAIDIVIFTGRRWILTDSVSITDYNNDNSETSSVLSLGATNNNNEENLIAKRNLATFLANNFHAYWSNYTFYFVSEPVDVGTPTDSATPVGLQWFRLETIGTKGASLHSGEQLWQGMMSIDAKLLCAVCHNETNPCFYGASCQINGTCNCTTGSSGRLCQIPPANNGNCDAFFNTPEFAYDGGDCCHETCTGTERYSCGKGTLENSSVVSANGFIGYPNCEDPRFKYKLSGSKTLYDVVDRGYLRCGSKLHPGFLDISNDGQYLGFELDLCKAIAAAVLTDPEAIEIVESEEVDRWTDLNEDKFDVLLLRTTQTAERDVFEGGARTGFSFVPTPYFFDGLRYSGIPPYSECADKLDFTSTECVNLKICVARSTTSYDTTVSLFPYEAVTEVESMQAMVDGLEAGTCNVIAGDVSTFASEYVVRQRGFTGLLYHVGSNVHSKDPLTAVVRQDDGVWLKFVSWIFQALVQAEESGITQRTAAVGIAPTDVFGERFKNMFQNAIAASGNFGEIYERNLEDKIPRGGLNAVNTGGSGLMYSFPFGDIDTHGPDPVVGGTIDKIRKRGILNCGTKRLRGFAELDATTGTWRGFEIDMCRGVAAAIFNGSPNVNYIPLSSAERFTALANGVVDMLAYATTHTLSREVNEVTTGQGFDFTPIIFYDGLIFAGRPPFAGCAEFLLFNDVDCRGTRICVADSTTWLDAMRGPLNIPEMNIVVTISHEESYYKFVSGDCNVITGESVQINEAASREFSILLNEEIVAGKNKHTKEPLALVSRSDDTQFSDFLRWIVHGFFYAEEQKVTRENVYNMPAGNYLFGNGLSGMWQHSIEAVGNYGEIYARNFEGILEREGQNNLNDNNGPQFYAKPGVTLKY